MIRSVLIAVYWLLSVGFVLYFLWQREYVIALFIFLLEVFFYFGLFFALWKKEERTKKSANASSVPIYWNLFISERASGKNGSNGHGKVENNDT